MPEIKLFYRPFCPYCNKVLAFLKEKNVEVPLVNISEDEKGRDELLQVGGKSQVPCLFIGGQPLYESDDIIEWFKTHAAQA